MLKLAVQRARDLKSGSRAQPASVRCSFQAAPVSEMRDPFLKYSLFSDHDSLLLRHSHEVLVSFLMYQFVLYPVVAPAVNRMIFGQHYTRAAPRTRANFDIHTVSTVQAVLCVGMIWPLLRLPAALPVFGFYDEYASLVAATMVGYFVWDVYLCTRYLAVFGPGFLGHALGSLAVLLSALTPAFQPWLGKFLIFEASTPLVNVNWFITQLARGSTSAVVPRWLPVVNGLLLLVTFFCVRIVWGVMALIAMDYYVWRQWGPETPKLVGLLVPAINFFMTLLNFYWFYKMVRIAKKMVRASKHVAKVT